MISTGRNCIPSVDAAVRAKLGDVAGAQVQRRLAPVDAELGAGVPGEQEHV